MIIIDGSEGEGGGQVLRYACALALLTGTPFTIENIRGQREKPGLMRQHVTAIEAACVIGGAECSGLAVGSNSIGFRPGRVTPGDYHFAVGTAGSTGLVLQTILVPLMSAEAPSHLVIEGGTHAMAAPPFEFIERTLLPVINRMGPTVSARLVRHGFFPRGGGRIEVDIVPAPLRAIECIERGAAGAVEATAVVAGIPFDVAQRELKAARKILTDWPEEAFVTRQLPADQGPGNALLVEARFDHVTEIVSAFGKLGIPAERLATTAARRMAGYVASSAFAGPYLQDQLLLPMAIAGGGAFTSVKLSEHSNTAMALIERFTGRRFHVSATGDANLVEVIA
ncbi:MULTISPECIES: RNA 3'-terminal phosphate cyclase [unclassified Sphingopyxis]|uniref:RNA 3'-terminal phosphate cyclase n=1 Tax=unclassified Sphingopyxis TaxID=2614943 RepID=UPI0007371C66|nr:MULTISPECIES: RNA 3'-terminal phosphate cyclase [unclassified Sphingopyxis]KTE38382.1 RNA 3'-phosphate cyclase [Sphingopyxis sp. HIX]KTE84168.1 RNA 3'-phosphate cyclase [Sphingopyxis sp. HXXIV]